MTIPKFKYHPDPIATGSIVPSENPCECCGLSRGFIYTGPVFARERYVDCICPWCIEDGSAYTKLGAEFVDQDGVGGGGEWCSVSEEIAQEVARRTPGFSGWQQEQWWTHCDDAGEYIGTAGKDELVALGNEAVNAIRESTGLSEGPRWESFFAALDKDGSPRSYLFRCRKCKAIGGYQDCD